MNCQKFGEKVGNKYYFYYHIFAAEYKKNSNKKYSTEHSIQNSLYWTLHGYNITYVIFYCQTKINTVYIFHRMLNVQVRIYQNTAFTKSQPKPKILR